MSGAVIGMVDIALILRLTQKVLKEKHIMCNEVVTIRVTKKIVGYLLVKKDI